MVVARWKQGYLTKLREMNNLELLGEFEDACAAKNSDMSDQHDFWRFDACEAEFMDRLKACGYLGE